MNTSRSIHNKDRGATAVEYALLAALIAGVVISAVMALGGNVLDAFTDPRLELPWP